MSTDFKSFHCVCGGTVRMMSAAGEHRQIRRGVHLEIPASIKVPKCDACGDSYLGPEDAARVDTAVRALHLARQATRLTHCIATLQQRHEVSVADIERACAVRTTYLSHLRGGKRLASETLMRLLEAYVAAPMLFARHTRHARCAMLRHQVTKTTELSCSPAAYEADVADNAGYVGGGEGLAA